MIRESLRPVTVEDLEIEERRELPDGFPWGCAIVLLALPASLAWAGFSTGLWPWVVVAAVLGTIILGMLVFSQWEKRVSARRMKLHRAERLCGRLPIRTLSGMARQAWIVPRAREWHDPLVLIDVGGEECFLVRGSDYDGIGGRSGMGPWLPETNPPPIRRDVEVVLDPVYMSRYHVIFRGDELRPIDLRATMQPPPEIDESVQPPRCGVRSLPAELVRLIRESRGLEHT